MAKGKLQKFVDVVGNNIIPASTFFNNLDVTDIQKSKESFESSIDDYLQKNPHVIPEELGELKNFSKKKDWTNREKLKEVVGIYEQVAQHIGDEYGQG